MMKQSSSGSIKSHKKSKSKQFSGNINNFSEKYMMYTKDKMFSSTPKKAQTPQKEFFSPRNGRNATSSRKNKHCSPFQSKGQKININMEIKNFNIYGQTNQTTKTKKKKLHKKTISCLSSLGKKEPLHEEKFKTPVPKHLKTKSQDNLNGKSSQWGDFVLKGSKKKINENIISKFAICTRTGYCPQKKDKVNQDTYISVENFMQHGKYLFGVCDGHGVNGHYVSEFIKQILPENIEYYFLKNRKSKKNNIELSLKESFKKTARNLLESKIDIMFSGTTACLLYIEHNILYCCNLGDSRAVIYSKSSTLNQAWNFKQLSTDHKADDKREALRIQMNGGRIFPYTDEDGEQVGPFRVWIKEQNIPGLAMTRSFGDYVASTVGVIDEPEILTHEITKQNKFIVVGSDGLWQFISNEEVMNTVIPAFIRNNPEEATKELENMAVKAWEREDESIDDITIQVIFLKYY